MLIHVGIIFRVSAQAVSVCLVFVIVYFSYTGVQNEVRCLPILVSKTKSDVDLIIWIPEMSNIQVDILPDNFKSI